MAESYRKYDKQLDEWLAVTIAKLPQLPRGGQDFLVEVLPWLALIGGIMGIVSALEMLGMGAMISPMWGLAGKQLDLYWLSSLVILASAGLSLAAFKPLRKKEFKGWKYLYYATLLNLAASLITFQIGGWLIDFVLFYLLYQIKKQYNQN